MDGEGRAFECLRCGKCCSGLVSEDRGVLRGLTLLPDELAIFSQDIVKPAVGIGEDPQDGDFRIIAYQLTEDTCPHLRERSCSAYADRPASCRQFPFSLRTGPEGNTQKGLDLSCPSLLETFREDPRPRIGFDMKPPAERLLRVQMEAAENPSRSWYFDLRADAWVSYAKLR